MRLKEICPNAVKIVICGQKLPLSKRRSSKRCLDVKKVEEAFKWQGFHFFNYSILLQSVTKILRPIPLPTISMLFGDVTAFGWTILVIQVACTSPLTLSWGKGDKNRDVTYSFKCFKSFNWF